MDSTRVRGELSHAVNSGVSKLKILYGVQGTGNGHITRARALAKHLKAAGAEVDYLFSGRPAEQYYEMECFDSWRSLPGLTFAVDKGRIKPLATVFNSRPIRFLHDIRSLSLDDYDLVISDFEPVSAWAACTQKKESIGIGHQYAFDHDVPKQGDNLIARTIMNSFAPTRHRVGLHWYHFQQPILPPIVDVIDETPTSDEQLILVYLPFEDQREIIELLSAFPDYQFLFYGKDVQQRFQINNVTCKPPSRQGFQKDLLACGGVICNAGFELASEAISLGKKLLVKPVHGQMEQVSNALALEQLQLGMATRILRPHVLEEWFSYGSGQRIKYPDVAEALAQWIMAGDYGEQSLQELIHDLWARTDSGNLQTFAPYHGSMQQKVA